MKTLSGAVVVLAILLGWSSGNRSHGSEMEEGVLVSDLVPEPVEYNVLLPDGYADTGNPVPLVLYLDGAGGKRKRLTDDQEWFDELWKEDALPRLVVVTPTVVPSCYYLDYKDGSQKWETFLVNSFLSHLRKKYNVVKERSGMALMGVSMGGAGALRLAFKHPDKFAGVAGLEPGIAPALKWRDVQHKNRFWYMDEHYETLYGKPVDEEYWQANNPACIAAGDAAKLRESGLKVYLECGDGDVFNLFEGAEFLHRIMWEKRIPHEYHLVHGADHLGKSVERRTKEALQFLGRVFIPPGPDIPEDRRRFILGKCPIVGAEGYLTPTAADGTEYLKAVQRAVTAEQ